MKVRRVRLSPEIMVEIMKNGTKGVRIVRDGLPNDATFVMATWDPARLTVWLLVTSETFADVPEPDIVPEHPRPIFENLSDVRPDAG